MEERKYSVSVTGYWNGDRELVVRTSPSDERARYVTGKDFGCSRDYYLDSDQDAIHAFMREHCCVATIKE